VKKLPNIQDSPFHVCIVEPLIDPFSAALGGDLDVHRLLSPHAVVGPSRRGGTGLLRICGYTRWLRKTRPA
jgi:hypothetical protein